MVLLCLFRVVEPLELNPDAVLGNEHDRVRGQLQLVLKTEKKEKKDRDDQVLQSRPPFQR